MVPLTLRPCASFPSVVISGTVSSFVFGSVAVASFGGQLGVEFGEKLPSLGAAVGFAHIDTCDGNSSIEEPFEHPPFAVAGEVWERGRVPHPGFGPA